MKHFIKLSSRVINKLHIIQIVKKPKIYDIYINNNTINGYLFFYFGSIRTNPNIIEICEKKDKKDYDTITDLFESEF